MTRQATELDPFGTTTDAAAYVPRPACEEALTALQQAFADGARQVAFTGPSGIGKTQMLRVLGARLEGQADLLVLPYAGLEFDDLCFFALGLLGEEGDPGRAVEDLKAAADRRGSEGRYLILALDDASALSKDAARKLIEMTDATAGAFRILVVPVDDPRAGRVLASLGKDHPEVRLSRAMTEEETHQYVRARLSRRPPSPEISGRFDEAALRWLHRESGGIPREVHHLCLILQRGLKTESPDAFNRKDQWLEVEVGDIPSIEIQDESSDRPPNLREVEPIPIHPMPMSPPVIDPESLSSSGKRDQAQNRSSKKVGMLALALLLVAGLRWGMSSGPGVPSAPAHLEEESLQGVPSAPVAGRDGASSVDPGTTGIAEPASSGLEPGLRIDDRAANDAFPVESLDGLVRDLVGGEDPSPEEDGARRFSVRETPLSAPLEAVAATTDSRPVAEGAVVFEPTKPQVEPSAGAFPAARAPEGGMIQINVNADPWAQVEIDGRDVGSTPLAGVSLVPGVHLFRLTFPDGHILEAERSVDGQNRHFVFGD